MKIITKGTRLAWPKQLNDQHHNKVRYLFKIQNCVHLVYFSFSAGSIQVLVRDSVPFQVTGFASLPAIQFADFRSNGTYITVSCILGVKALKTCTLLLNFRFIRPTLFH